MERPIRIQRKRTKGWRMPPNAVYVGRPTIYGNPFRSASDPEEAVWLFRNSHRLKQLIITGEIKKLRDKNLCCWCPLDKFCHADVLLEIANKP